MTSQVAFALVSLIVIGAAWRVVTSESVMRSALALVIVLGGMAPLFIMLGAEFLAVVQVLVYVGAVVVLFLFGIMLTHSPMSPMPPMSSRSPVPLKSSMQKSQDLDYSRRWPGLVVAAALFVVLWVALREAFGSKRVALDAPINAVQVGNALLRDHIIAFEAISVLLLAVLIGALVIARKS